MGGIRGGRPPLRLDPRVPTDPPFYFFLVVCFFVVGHPSIEVGELNAVAKPTFPQSPCAVAARGTRVMWPGNPRVPQDAWISSAPNNSDRIAWPRRRRPRRQQPDHRRAAHDREMLFDPGTSRRPKTKISPLPRSCSGRGARRVAWQPSRAT